MSRSYKKEPYVNCKPGSFKKWKRLTNRRFRSCVKQKLKICEDWDNLILPHKYEIWDIWDSPKDDIRARVEKPTLNQCELDRHKYKHLGDFWEKYYERIFQFNGKHYKYCDCYFNKRTSRYWKTIRK